MADDRRTRRRGFSPARLLSQVESTARWALDPEALHLRAEAASWRDWLLAAPEIEASWQEPEARVPYLRVMLASHFATVATLVPTDVDTHIRHHVWQEIETARELEDALAVVDEAATWSPRPVSARVVEVPGIGDVSGHAGEWLAVRAGALGRALWIGADDVAARIAGDIEAEIAREADAFARARGSGDFVLALCVATISAHNCGDLSRVVEAWPKQTRHREEHAVRFAKLGHEGAHRHGGEHHLAGHVNKEVMASENHRFLALRTPRALRASRDLIVPIAPFLDAWGETVGSHAALEEKDRGEALGALLTGLDQSVDRWGYHRAIAGIHRRSPGGIDRLAQYVPARLRAMIAKGPVRDALRVEPDRFLARMRNAYEAALASYRR